MLRYTILHYIRARSMCPCDSTISVLMTPRQPIQVPNESIYFQCQCLKAIHFFQIIKIVIVIWMFCRVLKKTFVTSKWWHHQMETFSALLALCVGNSPVTGEFPAQRPVTRSFDVFFVLRLNKRLSKQPWGWWFETSSWSLWRHCNALMTLKIVNTSFSC